MIWAQTLFPQGSASCWGFPGSYSAPGPGQPSTPALQDRSLSGLGLGSWGRGNRLAASRPAGVAYLWPSSASTPTARKRQDGQVGRAEQNSKALFPLPYKLPPRQGSQAADPPFLQNQPEGRIAQLLSQLSWRGVLTPHSPPLSLPASAQPTLGFSPGPLHSLPPRALAPPRAVLSSCYSGLLGVIALAEGVPHLPARQEP